MCHDVCIHIFFCEVIAKRQGKYVEQKKTLIVRKSAKIRLQFPDEVYYIITYTLSAFEPFRSCVG